MLRKPARRRTPRTAASATGVNRAIRAARKWQCAAFARACPSALPQPLPHEVRDLWPAHVAARAGRDESESHRRLLSAPISGVLRRSPLLRVFGAHPLMLGLLRMLDRPLGHAAEVVEVETVTALRDELRSVVPVGEKHCALFAGLLAPYRLLRP